MGTGLVVCRCVKYNEVFINVFFLCVFYAQCLVVSAGNKSSPWSIASILVCASCGGVHILLGWGE